MMEENGKIKSFAMNGGDGPNSYTKNSSYQRGVVDAAKEMIDEIISQKLDLNNSFFGSIFRMVDLGCSVGPNTFIAVQNITDAIKRKYKAENQIPNLNLELQVFFNDHVNNDFNTLFKSLPPSCQYFATGVPGSFHGRLFPRSSIHLAHLSFALHWLSKVPKEVTDMKSPAYNKGSIQCTGYVKEVVDAYASQFKNDMGTFLDARADEIVPGGFLIILASALPDGVVMSQTMMGMHHDLLGSCLYDMVKLGLLEEEEVDSFNLSSYFSHISELKELIEKNKYFNIEKIEILNNQMSFELQTIQTITSQKRAVMEGLIKDHLGDKIKMDDLFENFSQKLAKNHLSCDKKFCKNIELFILLERKNFN